jgi:TRAP-type C4-dicarboxylate transport system permease small subunit
MAVRLTWMPRGLDLGLSAADRIARAAVVLGGGLMLVSAFLIGADVFLRRVLGVSAWGAGELSNYALAISTSWALAYAMLTKTHIRLALVTERLPPALRAACDIAALLAMGWFAVMACLAIYRLFDRSWQRGTTSITSLATPLWIPQGLWLLGFVFFVLVIGLLLLRVLAALFVDRSYLVAARHGGAATTVQETEAAIAEARAATHGKGR